MYIMGNFLKVEVDTVVPSMSFKDAQKELASQGRKFNREALQSIPYSQLHLCCIGTAGAAICSPRLVYLEKERRLGRYVALAPEELVRSERWLKAEGMFDDVMAELTANSAPAWERLKPRQRLVATMFCLYNHTDEPEERAVEIIALLQESAGDGIPPMLCSELCSKMTDITRRYVGIGTPEKDRIGDPQFREGIFQCIEAILNIMSKEEQLALVHEHIRGYSCTSDCFRAY